MWPHAVVPGAYHASVKVARTYRFRLEPTPSLARRVSRIAGCCRFVYNRALAVQRERLDRGEPRLGYAALCRELTAWRAGGETTFLAQAPVHALQQALKDLDGAYRSFFEGRTDAPRFKKKGRRDAFRYPDRTQFQVDETHGRVKLPKLGWVRYRKSRTLAGAPKQLTIAREGRHWFVSIHAEHDLDVPRHPSASAVGVDLGVVRFAALSTGEVLAPADAFRRHRARLRRMQRALARKLKFGRNWQKQKTRIEQLHLKVARIRRDFLHKASTAISKTHAIVVLENLRVKSITGARSSTIAAGGVRVRARLNASVLDQGWGEFRRQLEYKQRWRGGAVIAVDPRNTSRTCAQCGHVAAESRPSRDEFRCVACGHCADADVNAARNILAAGHAAHRLRRGSAVGPLVEAGTLRVGRPPGDLAGISGRTPGEDAKR